MADISFKEKLQSLNFSVKYKGQSRKKLVQNQLDGTQAGYEIEHWDDSQDVVVQPRTITIKAGQSTSE